MGKIRRGGFVFFAWKGDHSPKHVHVYRDGRLVLKYDIENGKIMQGVASQRVLTILRALQDEGLI